MPVRSKRRLARVGRISKEKNKPRLGLILALIASVLLLLSGIFVFRQSKFYGQSSKLSLVTLDEIGNAQILVFDKTNKTITAIKVPAATEISASNQLGQWRVASLWKLGFDEKLGGSLLKNSLVKNFHLPIFVWADKPAMGFYKGDVKSIFLAVFSNYRSSFGLADRIRLGLFSLRISARNKTDFDISETILVKKARLTDGQNGFRLTGSPIPLDLLAIFANAQIANSNFKVLIHDRGGGSAVAESVGKTLENMGVKVVGILDEPKQSGSCSLVAKNKVLANFVNLVVGCGTVSAVLDDALDLEITLGIDFVKNY